MSVGAGPPLGRRGRVGATVFAARQGLSSGYLEMVVKDYLDNSPVSALVALFACPHWLSDEDDRALAPCGFLSGLVSAAAEAVPRGMFTTPGPAVWIMTAFAAYSAVLGPCVHRRRTRPSVRPFGGILW